MFAMTFALAWSRFVHIGKGMQQHIAGLATTLCNLALGVWSKQIQ